MCGSIMPFLADISSEASSPSEMMSQLEGRFGVRLASLPGDEVSCCLFVGSGSVSCC